MESRGSLRQQRTTGQNSVLFRKPPGPASWLLSFVHLDCGKTSVCVFRSPKQTEHTSPSLSGSLRGAELSKATRLQEFPDGFSEEAQKKLVSPCFCLLLPTPPATSPGDPVTQPQNHRTQDGGAGRDVEGRPASPKRGPGTSSVCITWGPGGGNAESQAPPWTC